MVLLRAPLGGHDPDALASAMRRFDSGLTAAGVLITDGGFSAHGRSARLSARAVAADDFPDTVAGCWLVSAPSKAELIDRFRRCPVLQADGCEIEVHHLSPGADEALSSPHDPAAGASAASRYVGGLSPRRLKAVVDYIEANLEHDLRIETIARVAGCSASHFSVVFRRTMGMPAHRYVVRRRVGRAVQLLASGQMSISEAAVACGFAHQSHLARAMRRELGKSPSEAAGRVAPPPADRWLLERGREPDVWREVETGGEP